MKIKTFYCKIKELQDVVKAMLVCISIISVVHWNVLVGITGTGRPLDLTEWNWSIIASSDWMLMDCFSEFFFISRMDVPVISSDF